MSEPLNDGERDFVHDLATPLNLVLLASESLHDSMRARSNADAEELQLVLDIRAAADQLTKLLEARRGRGFRQTTHPIPARSENRVGKEFTVLVIDDEPGIRDMTSKDLKKSGYRVLTATNGLEGIEILLKELVDLVITDVRMAEMSGIQLLKELRKHFPGPEPAVLLLTGNLGVSVERAMSMGAHGLIEKPFSRNDFLGKVKWLLTPPSERWGSAGGFSEDFLFECELDDYDVSAGTGEAAFGWGGVFLHTPGNVPEVGKRVKFRLAIGKPDPIVLSGGGQVTWRRTETSPGTLPGIGIEFLFFDQECLSAAISWLGARRPSAYIPDGRIGHAVPAT